MNESGHGTTETPADIDSVRTRMRNCTSCNLHEKRIQVVLGTGDGNADLMWIGEAPGPDEDLHGEPFTGRSGQLLDRIIEGIGNTRKAVFLANVVSCRLDDTRDLRRTHVEACRPHLEAQIAAVNPRIIVPLGATAWTWFKRGDKRKMADVRGTVYRWRGRLLVPTYHPAFLLRKAEYKSDVWHDVKTAAALLNRPETASNHEIVDITETEPTGRNDEVAPTLF